MNQLAACLYELMGEVKLIQSDLKEVKNRRISVVGLSVKSM